MDAEYDDADSVRAAVNLDRPAGRQQGNSSDDKPKVVQPKPQALPQRQGPSAILVSTRQKGNPILNHVKSLPWEYSDIPCDYVLGATTCALFLSLKYHRLHPEYIYSRIRQLGKLYNLRILLCMVDIENHEQALQELSKTSMINNFTLILAWSAQEAGRYIELYKSYEHASPSSIRARQAESWQESLTEFVTTPRNINKTDAASLVSNFGSLRAAVNAEPEELALIPGFGEKKVKAWYASVREPFRVKKAGKASVQSLRPDSGMVDAIPIGSIPASLSRENTHLNPAGTTRPTSNHKRQRLQEISPDDDIDVNEDNKTDFLATERTADILPLTGKTIVNEQDSSLSGIKNQQSSDAVRKDQHLSDGVAAALAKYRANT